MKTSDDTSKRAIAISWREQVGIGLIFALAALIFVPTFWRGLGEAEIGLLTVVDE